MKQTLMTLASSFVPGPPHRLRPSSRCGGSPLPCSQPRTLYERDRKLLCPGEALLFGFTFSKEVVMLAWALILSAMPVVSLSPAGRHIVQQLSREKAPSIRDCARRVATSPRTIFEAHMAIQCAREFEAIFARTGDWETLDLVSGIHVNIMRSPLYGGSEVERRSPAYRGLLAEGYFGMGVAAAHQGRKRAAALSFRKVMTLLGISAFTPPPGPWTRRCGAQVFLAGAGGYIIPRNECRVLDRRRPSGAL